MAFEIVDSSRNDVRYETLQKEERELLITVSTDHSVSENRNYQDFLEWRDKPLSEPVCSNLGNLSPVTTPRAHKRARKERTEEDQERMYRKIALKKLSSRYKESEKRYVGYSDVGKKQAKTLGKCLLEIKNESESGKRNAWFGCFRVLQTIFVASHREYDVDGHRNDEQRGEDDIDPNLWLNELDELADVSSG